MRALRFHDHGDPSVVRVDEVPEPPAPRGDQILVQVGASSINGTDLGLRRGGLKVATLGRLPFPLGFDLAGEVVACGPEVTAFGVGDQVIALLGHGGGGQAERVLLRQHRAAAAPRSCSTTDAAALPLAGLTALQALHRVAALHTRPDSRVLVVGASGGIGSFAVQLARLAGAEVTGVASGSKLDFVRDLGAARVLDRTTTDLATHDERYDVVFDVPGVGSRRLAHLVDPDGVLVTSRPVSPDVLLGTVRRFLPGSPDRPRRAGVMTAARSYDLARLASLVDRGELRIPVDAVYGFDQAVAAHEHAQSRVRGKVVLTP